MSTPPFIVIRLQPGWALGADGTSLVVQGQSVPLDLPAGSHLVQALVVPPPAGGHRTAAEDEIARYLHLQLPADLSAGAAQARAAVWPGVERVTLPPGLSPA